MNWIDYRKRLGIGFSNKDKVKYFMTRISNYLQRIDVDAPSVPELSTDFLFEYCNITGTEFDDLDYGNVFEAIIEDVRGYDAFEEFLIRYVVFINLLVKPGKELKARKKLLEILCENLKAATIPYDVIEDEGCFVFPKGAAELDVALVSTPLEWLAEYPNSHTAFVKALKQYAEATEDNASDIADKFRKALETFMQEFFTCNKTLENCKAIYGTYLKEQGVPKEIVGNLETLLQAYSTFINGYAKHHDRTSVNVLEYVMYQTGNIIRLLITLKKKETK